MPDYERFLSTAGSRLQESAIRRMGTVIAHAPDMVSFAAGYPDATLFPWGELRAITNEVLTDGNAATLQYGPTRGYQPLLEALVEVLDGRGIRVGLDDVLITSGSQQGLDLVARVLLSPGDVALVELPAFTGAIAAFTNAQARLSGVAQDADGISLGQLDAVWQRETRAGRTVKLLYVVPNFQNPAGTLLAPDRRTRLLDWADRRDVLLVEDDPYGELFFDEAAGAATRPLRADDPTGRVIYLSTFSKTLAPGFRVGWMVAPPPLVERFETAKQSADLMTGSLDQRVCCEALRRGVVKALVPRLRERYRQKRDEMDRALRDELGSRLTWLQPRGGFFLWATLPEGETDTRLLERALRERLVFVTGSAFFVDGTGHDRIRLAFSAPPMAQIREGAKRLAAALGGK